MLLRVFILQFLWTSCLGLYEDQVGKWDWIQRHVGEVKFMNFGNTFDGNLIVATNRNLIAAINSRNAKIKWRKLFEEDERGVIQALSTRGTPVVVSGQKTPMIRSFKPSGGLQFEMNLPFTPPRDASQEHFIDADRMKVISVYSMKNELIISDFSYATKEVITSEKISAGYTKCVLAGGLYYVCLDNKQLRILTLSQTSAGFSAVNVDVVGQGIILKALPEGPYVTLQSGPSISLYEIVNGNSAKLIKSESVYREITAFKSNGAVYTVFVKDDEDSCVELIVFDKTHREIPELSATFCIPNVFAPLKSISVVGLLRKDGEVSYRTFILTQDAGILMFHKDGRLLWSREESLAEVLNVQFVDLPLTEIEARIEEEFTEEPSDIFSMFAKRIYSQLQQLVTLFDTKSALSNFGLVRDNFGFHKVLFVATRIGKFYLIDNISSDILWSKFLPDIRPFENGQYIIVTQRTTAHFPRAPVLTVLGLGRSNKIRIFSINPITGQVYDDSEIDFAMSQLSVLQPDAEFLKGILLFDEISKKVMVYPKTSELDYKQYQLTVSKKGSVRGYAITNGAVEELWSMQLASGSVVNEVAVKGNENVHSQGRVLGDRTVLYKYVNPNQAAIITSNAQQSSIFVYLIDVVSGSMIYQTVHKKARGPVHVVHSENWLVYTYMSEKSRRQEISAIDLYEGLDQPNSTFSSFSAVEPMVEHSTFILPDHIVHMKETVTEKGITSKWILAANAQGNILEIPKAMLDPRRPVTPTVLHREEGLIPYVPEIIVPPTNVLNYNQTIARIRGIETAPSGLESTCLVFSYGLDMYYTRVAPSQNFDILKDNFEHLLICAVLAALVVGSYVTKSFAAKKALKTAWK